MPKNVMKLLKPSPNYGRNDFDLSHRNVFTANFGELVPSFCVETLPKDKIRVKVSDLVRAQPMVTSPFLRAKQHVDVWFVPYNLIWSRFNEFLVDKDEPSSSALHDRLYVPSVRSVDLADAIKSFDNATYSVHGVGSEYARAVARNLDLLGYSGTLLYNEAKAGTYNFPDNTLNLWRLAAYQLIWYREYRQQYYDDGKLNLPSSVANLSNGASYLFNFDFLTCDTFANSDLGQYLNGQAIEAALLTPRYRCWKKDIYTGLMPDTQFGNISIVSSTPNGPLVTSNLGVNFNSTTDYLYSNSSGQMSTVSNGVTSSIVVPQSNFDILALRKSEAIQKWRENALRAGNQVQDNFESHFGVKPKSHMEVHPTHVASFDASLNIGDVNAQAQIGTGANQSLADVAGKGIMSFGGNETLEFETSDYGVLMGIYSVLPEAEYNANDFDRLNCLLEREDYFFPEYENLGLEAVDFTTISTNRQTNGVLGYAPRYFGYKQKHDRCCGEFMQYQGYNGQFRFWCSPKYDVDDAINQGTLPLTTLYVNPSVFNVNFGADWNIVPQFLVDMYVDCDAIRQMSVSGMPGY